VNLPDGGAVGRVGLTGRDRPGANRVQMPAAAGHQVPEPLDPRGVVGQNPNERARLDATRQASGAALSVSSPVRLLTTHERTLSRTIGRAR
jgi:hypothetical protein